MDRPAESKTDWNSFRWRLYIILEAGKTGDRLSQIFDWSMVILILANVVGFTLGTVPEVYDQYGPTFETFNVVSVLIFTVGYLLRLWVSIEHKPLAVRGPTKVRPHFPRYGEHWSLSAARC